MCFYLRGVLSHTQLHVCQRGVMYVQAWDLKMCVPIREVSSFQVLCTGFNGVGT